MQDMDSYIIFFTILSLISGSVIGAYFGTISYRIRVKKPLTGSKCYCPDCGHELFLRDQIPMISWFIIGRKCRFCKKSISVRYPLSEGGFALFYGVTFILLHRFPVILFALWLSAITAAVFSCGKNNIRGAIKGTLLMYGLHLIFCVPIGAFLYFYNYIM